MRLRRLVRWALLAVLLGMLIGATLWIAKQHPAIDASTDPTPTPLGNFSFDRDHLTNVYCAEIASAWQANDWPRVIRNLRALQSMAVGCGDGDPAAKLYPAYYNYGVALERAGDLAGALNAYQQALTYKADGREAALALRKHDALTPIPRPTCTDQQLANAEAIPAYQPSGGGSFIHVDGSNFMLDGSLFPVRGVNYYPANAPWHRFLTDPALDNFSRDFDLIRDVGFNVIRIFLWYGALFRCPGSGVIPDAAAFARLDSMLQLAAARGLHVLVTLNDLPDLWMYPLYTDAEVPLSQTAFIVNRYRQERMILAWDVRNEGDVDYVRGNAHDSDVYAWLAQTVATVRTLDGQHPITAGWDDNGLSTANVVDVVSLHHWASPDSLDGRLKQFRAATTKPILLEEVGYSAYPSTESRQSTELLQAIQTAEADKAAGWIIWQTFDLSPGTACDPPDCPGIDNAEYHFGLWHTDGSPKMVVAAIKQWLSAH